jgi:hypothetical protein
LFDGSPDYCLSDIIGNFFVAKQNCIQTNSGESIRGIGVAIRLFGKAYNRYQKNFVDEILDAEIQVNTVCTESCSSCNSQLTDLPSDRSDWRRQGDKNRT